MATKTTPDTVPGLGFKDKEKAEETLKILEGRDPDYQKLAIKGLIGRAKRTLTLTKAEDKVKNIKDAVGIFEKWLEDFEKLGKAKDNKPYLPLDTVKVFLPLKEKNKIEDEDADSFLEAYQAAGGDYKHLRTVTSEENGKTWDIVRNKNLQDLLENVTEDTEMFDKNGIPTKDHLKIILWAYSPLASKIKKSLPELKKAIGGGGNGSSEEEDEDDEDEEEVKPRKKTTKKKSSSSSEDESPKKKTKKN